MKAERNPDAPHQVAVTLDRKELDELVTRLPAAKADKELKGLKSLTLWFDLSGWNHVARGQKKKPDGLGAVVEYEVLVAAAEVASPGAFELLLATNPN